MTFTDLAKGYFCRPRLFTISTIFFMTIEQQLGGNGETGGVAVIEGW